MKKLLSFLLVIFMILPFGIVPVSADNADWSYLAAKYSTRTKLIIAPKNNDYKIRDDYFIFNEYGNGGIKVTTPNYDTFAGAFGVSAITSKKTLPLEDLSVVINPDEFDFTQDKHGRSNQISLIWSDKPVTRIAGDLNNGAFTTGIYNSSQLACGGLRNILSPNAKGLCVTLSSADPDNEGTKTATTVRIVYYDGSYTDENGNLGYCWVFTRNPAEGISPMTELSVKTTPYEDIDLSYGLIINIKSDSELGYVVNINGKDYLGENAGYRNGKMSDIDLNALKSISGGYITVGAVSNDDQTMNDHRCNYTLSYINNKRPVALWGNAPVPHEHSYTEELIEPTCTEEGSKTYTCDCGENYSEIIAATGHTEGERKETALGDIDVYCAVCGEYMYTKTGFKPHVHFDDVKESHWYYDSICHVISKGYMYGMNERTFSPNTDLTREQFVTILANMAGVETEEYRDMALMSDVKPTHWFAGAVNWAVSEGYVAGVSEGVFGVGQPIQRAALARLLYLYAERNGKQTEEKADLSVYTDFNKVQDWMAEGLSWAVKHGVITSIKDNELVLAPTATATRAQAARMLTVYDSIPDATLTPDSIPDPKPLEVDTSALKERLVEMGNKNIVSNYCFKISDTSIVYDEENDELYALSGITLRYHFGGDRVEILGAGNVRPLFEIYGDYELLLPYQVVKGYAEMTADGIIGAPEKYKDLCDDFYDDLMSMLEVLDVLKQ